MNNVHDRTDGDTTVRSRHPALLALSAPGLGAGLGAPAMWGRVELGGGAADVASGAHPSLVWFGSDQALLIVAAAVLVVALALRGARALAAARLTRAPATARPSTARLRHAAAIGATRTGHLGAGIGHRARLAVKPT